jgi:hypothetical protein
MTQVPALRKATVEPEIEHVEAVRDGMVKTTAFPEAPPVALGR